MAENVDFKTLEGKGMDSLTCLQRMLAGKATLSKISVSDLNPLLLIPVHVR